MMILLSLVGLVDLAASLHSKLGPVGGVYVMLVELVVIAGATVVVLTWLSPRLKRRAI